MNDVSMQAVSFQWLDVMMEVVFMIPANSDIGVRYGKQ